MRWILVCALIVSQVRADEPRLEPKERLIRLSSPKHFRSRCGPGNGNVYACTQFVGPKLSAQCARGDGGWSMRSNATYTALVYIFKSEFIRHEKLHQQDIERDIDSYLRTLESRTFSTAGECEIAAGAESEKFTTVMQESARQSNVERGCTRR